MNVGDRVRFRSDLRLELTVHGRLILPQCWGTVMRIEDDGRVAVEWDIRDVPNEDGTTIWSYLPDDLVEQSALERLAAEAE